VIGPKVRQVGFVTPDSSSIAAEASSSAPAVVSATAAGSPPSSLSPVMIPPPRHPSAEMSNPHYHPIGSYNPSEKILGSPPALSPSRSSRFDADGSDFSEDDESVALSGVGGGMTPKSSLLIHPPVTKTAPLVSGIAFDIAVLAYRLYMIGLSAILKYSTDQNCVTLIQLIKIIRDSFL
jgi:hypothetical protein